MRRHAKAINFGLIYGMSAFGLTRTTDLTLAESEDFVDAYFKQFPGVRKYINDVREMAKKDEYVETLLGRRRYFHGLATQSNALVRNRQLREAINSPIQGAAADIMKLAMLAVPPALKKAGLKAQVLLQVHDELIVECPEEEVKETAALVMKEMSAAYTLKVPLKTEARAGLNWGKMSEIDD
jgi:DNA polymerase-1